MKKFIRIFLMIAAMLLLLGSFPIRYCWGQRPCDIVRLIGFALVFINSVCLFCSKSKSAALSDRQKQAQGSDSRDK